MSIEVRYDDERKVDEIIASDCKVHLERMDNDHWCLIIETENTRGHFTIRRKHSRKHRCHVDAEVIEMNKP